jgi:L-amino acid N-acyltransferase YncA
LLRPGQKPGRSRLETIAVIGDSNQPASIALHAAAGFRLVGTLDAVGFKFDRWLDSVLMQRPLGEGATSGP